MTFNTLQDGSDIKLTVMVLACILSLQLQPFSEDKAMKTVVHI